MPLFSRRNAPADPNTATATGTHEKRSWMGTRHGGAHANGHSNGVAHGHGHAGGRTRPTFGEWVKGTWLDILTMAAMGAIGLGVYFADPAPTRSFPITFQDGEVVYPEFAYPMRRNIIPIYAAALLAALIPMFIFVVMQIRVRSFWDLNNAILGLLYSLISAAVFQVFIKWLIGGLRPHFLAACQPALPPNVEIGNGYKQIMYDRSICTGDRKEINDSLESFPSGHSTAAFAGFMFLYFYLNAKLKVFSNHHPAMWKLIALYAPVLGAVLIAGSLTIDEFHNWYDVVGGGIIGTTFAISAYRMVYASVWDFRFNHIPLARNQPFAYGLGQETAGGVFTHKADWGMHGAGAGGAPFDAGHGAGSSMAGAAHNMMSGGHHNGVATEGAGITNGHGHHGRHSIDRRPLPAATNGHTQHVV